MKASKALFYILKLFTTTFFNLVIFVVLFSVELFLGMFFSDAAEDKEEKEDKIDVPNYDYVEQDGELVWVDRKAFYR